MLAYYKANNFSYENFLTLYNGLFSLLIKVLSVFEYNFFILKSHCFMFLLNFNTSKYRIKKEPVFPDIPSSWSVFSQLFPQLLWICLLWFYWGP